ncbi:hypothetical protein CUMW_088970, partial [Citrus unshiu]
MLLDILIIVLFMNLPISAFEIDWKTNSEDTSDLSNSNEGTALAMHKVAAMDEVNSGGAVEDRVSGIRMFELAWSKADPKFRSSLLSERTPKLTARKVANVLTFYKQNMIRDYNTHCFLRRCLICFASSLHYGGEMMVARLQSLEDAEKQRRYKLDELKSAERHSSSGRYSSDRKEINIEPESIRLSVLEGVVQN